VSLSARDLIAKTSSPERTFDICLNGQLRGEQLELEAELAEAKRASDGKMGANPRIVELQEQLDAMAPQVEDATISFRFKGISHWRLKEIQRRFPTEERGQSWDVDAGAPSLIAECLIDPKLTAEEVRELLENGNQRLADEFIAAAMVVCQQGNEIPKSGRGFGRTGGSGSK
jgi:hypothetical protein